MIYEAVVDEVLFSQKSSIVDVWLGSKYACVNHIQSPE